MKNIVQYQISPLLSLSFSCTDVSLTAPPAAIEEELPLSVSSGLQYQSLDFVCVFFFLPAQALLHLLQ